MGTYPVTVGEISPTLDTLGGTPAIIFGTSVLAGVATTFLRTDDRIKFPADLMSAANSSTLALTDTGTDQVLTGSLGGLTVTPNNNLLTLGWFNSGGGTSAANTVLMQFVGLTSVIGTTPTTAISGNLNWNAAATHTGTLTGIFVNVTQSTTPVFTNVTLRGIDITNTISPQSTNAGQTWTEKTGLNITNNAASQSGVGTLTVTDTFGVRIAMATTLGTPGTFTNAYGARFPIPNFGGTIRRGVMVLPSTTNFGTEAAAVEGFYCDTVARGLTDRYNYRAIGATTGTPTNAYGYHCASHGVGTNRWSMWGANKFHCDLSDFIANASGFGFSNRDSQSSSVGGGGTARYWRMFVDASATGVAGDVTINIDSTGVVSATRLGGSTGTVQLRLVDVGTAAVLT